MKNDQNANSTSLESLDGIMKNVAPKTMRASVAISNIKNILLSSVCIFVTHNISRDSGRTLEGKLFF